MSMQTYEQAVLQSALWVVTKAFDHGVEKYTENVTKEVNSVAELLSKLFDRNQSEVWTDLRRSITEVENNGISIKIINVIEDKKALFEYRLLME